MKVDSIKSICDGEGLQMRKAQFLKSWQIVCVISFSLVFLFNIISALYESNLLKEKVARAASGGYKAIAEDINSIGAVHSELKKVELMLSDLKVNMPKGSSAIADAQSLVSAGVDVLDVLGLLEDINLIVENFVNSEDRKKDLIAIEANLDNAVLLTASASEKIGDVNFFKNDNRVEVLRGKIEVAKTVLSELSLAFENMKILLGFRYPHRILFVLQNSSEIRPTGGFIGSLGILDMNNGEVDKLQFKDIYEYDGQGLKREPTREIASVAGSSWGIRDANTSFDFEVSAKQIKKFLEEAGGPGVDSVIAIDLYFIEDLLKLTGPIYLKEADIWLNADNFSYILSYFVETKIYGQSTPKEIMKYFMDELVRNVASIPLPDLLEFFGNAITSKHFFAFSDDSDVQRFFEDFGADGGLPPVRTYDDFLGIAYSSVGGNKTDAFIREKQTHESVINKSGEVRNILKIERQHTWSSASRLWIEDQIKKSHVENVIPDFIRILGEDDNKVFARVYVPFGSKLVDTNGVKKDEVYVGQEAFDIKTAKGEESIKLTYFSFPITTKLGETSQTVISYTTGLSLDFDPVDDYRLMYYAPAGRDGIEFEKTIFIDDNLKFLSTENFLSSSDSEYSYKSLLKSDKILSTVIGLK